MAIWITGARGFIGRYLSKQLSKSGSYSIGIGNGERLINEKEEWGLKKFVKQPVLRANLDKIAEQEGEPDAIFHLAGGSSVGASFLDPSEDFQRTINSAFELFEWVRTKTPKTSIVVVSSAAVYGSGKNGFISASASTNPFSPYGYHKLMLEELTRSFSKNFGLYTVIVRLFSVYGPFLRKQLLWDLCSRLAIETDQLQLAGDGGELRDWTEVSDIARLLEDALVLACPQSKTINGGSGIGTSVKEITEEVIANWGKQIPISFSGQSRVGDPYSLISTPCEILNSNFKFKIPIKVGISNYVNWFKKNIL